MANEMQVVQQAYESFSRGDIPGVLASLSEEVDWSVSEAVPGFVHVFTVQDGQVVRFREFVDPDETLRGT